MEFNTIYRNGKPQYFFIKIDEQFAPTGDEIRAYQAYWDFLNALVIKYNKTARQIASAINY